MKLKNFIVRSAMGRVLLILSLIFMLSVFSIRAGRRRRRKTDTNSSEIKKVQEALERQPETKPQETIGTSQLERRQEAGKKQQEAKPQETVDTSELERRQEAGEKQQEAKPQETVEISELDRQQGEVEGRNVLINAKNKAFNIYGEFSKNARLIEDTTEKLKIALEQELKAFETQMTVELANIERLLTDAEDGVKKIEAQANIEAEKEGLAKYF